MSGDQTEERPERRFYIFLNRESSELTFKSYNSQTERPAYLAGRVFMQCAPGYKRESREATRKFQVEQSLNGLLRALVELHGLSYYHGLALPWKADRLTARPRLEFRQVEPGAPRTHQPAYMGSSAAHCGPQSVPRGPSGRLMDPMLRRAHKVKERPLEGRSADIVAQRLAGFFGCLLDNLRLVFRVALRHLFATRILCGRAAGFTARPWTVAASGGECRHSILYPFMMGLQR